MSKHRMKKKKNEKTTSRRNGNLQYENLTSQVQFLIL